MYPITDTKLKNLYTLKQMHEKPFIFLLLSVIKTCVTDLNLKDKNSQK